MGPNKFVHLTFALGALLAAFVVAGIAVGWGVVRLGRREVAPKGVEPVVPVVGERGEELLGDLHGR